MTILGGQAMPLSIGNECKGCPDLKTQDGRTCLNKGTQQCLINLKRGLQLWQIPK
jgi:hypothetical protein